MYLIALGNTLLIICESASANERVNCVVVFSETLSEINEQKVIIVSKFLIMKLGPFWEKNSTETFFA